MIIVVGLIGVACSRLPVVYLIRTRIAVAAPAQAPRPPDAPTIRSAACCSRSRAIPTRIEEDAESPSCASPRRAARGAAARALPGVPAPRRRRRSAARPDRHGHRHDHHVPEHHRVGLERSEADGQRHRPGDDRDGARSRHRRPAAVRATRGSRRCRARSCRSSTSRAPACSPRASSASATCSSSLTGPAARPPIVTTWSTTAARSCSGSSCAAC